MIESLIELFASLFGYGKQYRKYVKPFVPNNTTERTPIQPWVRTALLANAGFKCQLCGSGQNLQIDHVVPHSWGGSDDISNLQVLCQRCNASKSNNSSADYR